MKLQIVAGLVAVLALTGCQSRLNPGNWGWFGGSRSVETLEPRGGYAPDYDPRPLVSQVTEMRVDQAQGGAIITAVGLPPTQGYWAADLVSTYRTVTGDVAAKDGVLQFEFVIVPPPQPRNVVNTASREVSAGTFVTDQTLRGVHTVRVIGQNNQRSSRR